MRIELVYFEGCPHADQARSRLRAALEQAGMKPTWREWDSMSPDTPAEYRRHGSPTVLINGVDVSGGVAGDGCGCVANGGPTIQEIGAALGTSGATLRG
jgi:hypothetical protein